MIGGEPKRASRNYIDHCLLGTGIPEPYTGMTCWGRFYVVGPPVQYEQEVMDVVGSVMTETPGLNDEAFTLHDLEGPVRYDSTWVPGARRKALRPGMQRADLWTGKVMWHHHTLSRSFSVIVMDQQFLQIPAEARCDSPGFETFIVSVLHGDSRCQSCL